MDLNKYQNYKFNDDEKINAQIKALMLKLDFEVINLKLDYSGQIKLIERFISEFKKLEHYEYIGAFQLRKALLENGVVNIDRIEKNFYSYSIIERVKKFIKKIKKTLTY